LPASGIRQQPHRSRPHRRPRPSARYDELDDLAGLGFLVIEPAKDAKNGKWDQTAMT